MEVESGAASSIAYVGVSAPSRGRARREESLMKLIVPNEVNSCRMELDSTYYRGLSTSINERNALAEHRTLVKNRTFHLMLWATQLPDAL